MDKGDIIFEGNYYLIQCKNVQGILGPRLNCYDADPPMANNMPFNDANCTGRMRATVYTQT